MRKLIRLLLICASVAILYGSQAAMAQVDRSLEGDKKCTTCHDENWSTPVLKDGFLYLDDPVAQRLAIAEQEIESRLSGLSRHQCRAHGRSGRQITGCGVWIQIKEAVDDGRAECSLPELSRIEGACAVALVGQPARNAWTGLYGLP